MVHNQVMDILISHLELFSLINSIFKNQLGMKKNRKQLSLGEGILKSGAKLNFYFDSIYLGNPCSNFQRDK